MTSISRAGAEPDHRPLPARPRPRRRRRRRARPRRAGAQRAARRDRRAGRSPRSRPTPSRSSIWRFSSDRHSPLEVTDFADRFVKDRLQNLPGVADVPIFGERALRHAHLARSARASPPTPDAAGRRGRAARARTSRSRPAASRAGSASSPSLAETDLRTPEQFDDLIIRDAGGYLVRLKDVGQAELGAARRAHRSPASTASAAVALGVVKQSTANPLEVSARRCARRCRRSATILPEGMKIDVGYDTSIFIAALDRERVPHHRRGDRAGRAGDLRLPALVCARR